MILKDVMGSHVLSTQKTLKQNLKQQTANLNASKKKKNKKLKESPLQMKHGDAIDLVLDKIKDVIRKDLERGKVDSLNKLGKMVKVKASGVDNKPGRHVVTLNQEFTMDEREDTTTKE